MILIPRRPKDLLPGWRPSGLEVLVSIIPYIDRLTCIVNQSKCKYPLIYDEIVTGRAYNTIAIGNSNNIIPVNAIQNLSKLRTQYSREEADLFLNISDDLFSGQAEGETTFSPSITAAKIVTLSTGESLGIVADDPNWLYIYLSIDNLTTAMIYYGSNILKQFQSEYKWSLTGVCN